MAHNGEFRKNTETQRSDCYVQEPITQECNWTHNYPETANTSGVTNQKMFILIRKLFDGDQTRGVARPWGSSYNEGSFSM